MCHGTCAEVRVRRSVCGGPSTTYMSWFSPSTVWVPGLELRLAGLVAVICTSWAIPPAQWFSLLSYLLSFSHWVVGCYLGLVSLCFPSEQWGQNFAGIHFSIGYVSPASQDDLRRTPLVSNLNFALLQQIGWVFYIVYFCRESYFSISPFWMWFIFFFLLDVHKTFSM